MVSLGTKRLRTFHLPRCRLHEVVLPVFVAILVTCRGHIVVCEQFIVSMILLPFLLFPLLRLLGFFFLLWTVSVNSHPSIDMQSVKGETAWKVNEPFAAEMPDLACVVLLGGRLFLA